MKTWLKTHALRTTLVIAAALSCAYLYGCPVRAPSPQDPRRQLTAAELHIELNHLLNLYELRQAEIAERQRIRNLITQNALTIATEGTINPLGVITALAGIYGMGSIAKDTKNALTKKKTTNTA